MARGQASRGLVRTSAGLELDERLGASGEPLDLGGLLRFEVLVDAEEVGDLVSEVLGYVLDVDCAVPLWVVLEHGDELRVDTLLVAHGEHAENANPHDATGEGRVGDEHQDVERVAIARQGVGDEAVVRRVGGGGEEAAVQPDHVLLVVVLVLVAAPGGYLDHHVDRLVELAHVGDGASPRVAGSTGLMMPTPLPSGSLTTA